MVGTAASILAAAGCGTTGNVGQQAPTPSAPAPGNTAASTAQVCGTAAAAGRDLLGGVVSDALPEAADGSGSSTAVREGLVTYGSRLRTEAAEATDPVLRSQLEQTAAAADELAESPDPAGLEGSDFEKATKEMGALCGQAVPPPTPTATPTGTSGGIGIGAKESACELPVTFEVVPTWKPSTIGFEVRDELFAMYRSGPFTAICEVDAKPAGHLGFLRVYTAPGTTNDSPRRNLETFVSGELPDLPDALRSSGPEVRDATYTDIEVGGRPASEVRYETYNAALKLSQRVVAFAVATPRGAVLVTLGGLASEEYAQMLPAYELAKRTLTVKP